MLNYPKIKLRFPIAYNELSELSLKTGITEINRLVYEYFKIRDEIDSFFLIKDLKRIEEGDLKEVLFKYSNNNKFEGATVEYYQNTIELLKNIYGVHIPK